MTSANARSVQLVADWIIGIVIWRGVGIWYRRGMRIDDEIDAYRATGSLRY
jgi:hypothetical protein